LRSLIEHLDAELDGAKGFADPFPVHFLKPFPAEFYPAVIANLPDDELYEDLIHKDAMRADGTSTRKMFSIDEYAPVFWRDLSFVLCGPEVEDVFRDHIGFEGPVRAFCRLFRDFAGYRISPHPDSSKKAMTAQFYLPEDETQADLGTSFFSWRPSNGFEENCRLKFLPNTGYCFKVTENSFHGTNFSEIGKPRDSLILTYYKA